MKYYIVWSGRQPGVYESWEECKEQIHKVKGACYKAFKGISRSEAEQIWSEGAPTYRRTGKTTGATTTAPIVPHAIAVDAACSGNPGKLEYRGVDTTTGAVRFHKVFPLGTNNIGEFLAIVHAMAWMLQEGSIAPIYSDSANAITWVQKKKCNSKLPRNQQTRELWQTVDRAVEWLQSHDIKGFRIEKWQTKQWGEIPADFGRK